MCSPLADLADVTTVAHVFRFLNADDPFVARVARSALVAPEDPARAERGGHRLVPLRVCRWWPGLAFHLAFVLLIAGPGRRGQNREENRVSMSLGLWSSRALAGVPSTRRSDGYLTSGRQTASHWPNASRGVGALYVRASRKAGPEEGVVVDIPPWSE